MKKLFYTFLLMLTLFHIKTYNGTQTLFDKQNQSIGTILSQDNEKYAQYTTGEYFKVGSGDTIGYTKKPSCYTTTGELLRTVTSQALGLAGAAQGGWQSGSNNTRSQRTNGQTKLTQQLSQDENSHARFNADITNLNATRPRNSQNIYASFTSIKNNIYKLNDGSYITNVTIGTRYFGINVDAEVKCTLLVPVKGIPVDGSALPLWITDPEAAQAEAEQKAQAEQEAKAAQEAQAAEEAKAAQEANNQAPPQEINNPAPAEETNNPVPTAPVVQNQSSAQTEEQLYSYNPAGIPAFSLGKVVLVNNPPIKLSDTSISAPYFNSVATTIVLADPSKTFEKVQTVAVDASGNALTVYKISDSGATIVGYQKGETIENAKLNDVVALLSDNDGVYSSKASFSTTLNQSYELANGGRIADITRGGTIFDPTVTYTAYVPVKGDANELLTGAYTTVYAYNPAGIPAFTKTNVIGAPPKTVYDLTGEALQTLTISFEGKNIVGYIKSKTVENAKLNDVVALLSDNDGPYSSKASFSTTLNQSYALDKFYLNAYTYTDCRISDIVRSGTLQDPLVTYTVYLPLKV